MKSLCMSAVTWVCCVGASIAGWRLHANGGGGGGDSGWWAWGRVMLVVVGAVGWWWRLRRRGEWPSASPQDGIFIMCSCGECQELWCGRGICGRGGGVAWWRCWRRGEACKAWIRRSWCGCAAWRGEEGVHRSSVGVARVCVEAWVTGSCERLLRGGACVGMACEWTGDPWRWWRGRGSCGGHSQAEEQVRSVGNHSLQWTRPISNRRRAAVFLLAMAVLTLLKIKIPIASRPPHAPSSSYPPPLLLLQRASQGGTEIEGGKEACCCTVIINFLYPSSCLPDCPVTRSSSVAQS